ncbi:MAG: hypothetical protein JXR03_14895 [Cyclobacteriaceae bacterium]
MKRLALIIIIAIQFSNSFAQESQVEKKIFQLSWIPPLSTNKPSDSVIYYSSVNILAGSNHGVEGVEFGSLVNITRTNSGFAQFAGLTNLTGKTATGIQAAGLANRAKTVKGTQMAGLINSVNTSNGLQLAGLANQADTLNGVQISGLVNYAKTVNGLQLGFINIADTVESGASIGFISIVKTGLHHFEVSNNDVIAVNLTFRSGTDRFYGIFTAGIQARSEPLWTAGLGFGTRFDLKKDKIVGSVEVTGSGINRTQGNLDQELNLLNKLSFNVGYQLTKRILINAGPVLNVYVTRDLNSESGKYGYNLNHKNLFNQTSNGTNTRMWIGYQAGIWF